MSLRSGTRCRRRGVGRRVVRSKAKWKIGAGVESGGQAKKGALAGWRRAEESFPVMRLLSKPISSWRAERPVPLASQKSTLDNASRYGWSNLLLSRTAARGEKKAGGKGGGGAEWQGQDGGSRTYSRHTTSSCFIHRFETNSKRVLFVACFLFVTDNVVVLLLSELSGLYLPVQGCMEDTFVNTFVKSLFSSLILFFFLSFLFFFSFRSSFSLIFFK